MDNIFLSKQMTRKQNNLDTLLEETRFGPTVWHRDDPKGQARDEAEQPVGDEHDGDAVGPQDPEIRPSAVQPIVVNLKGQDSC